MRLARSLATPLIASIVVLTTLVVVLVPVVPYSVSFSIPGNYGNTALEVCGDTAFAIIPNSPCLTQNGLPPVVIEGRATPAYRLTGYGSSPYPGVLLVTQGNLSALVYFQGSAIAAAEGPFNMGGPTVLEPPGFAQITDVALTPSSSGMLNLSAIISVAGTGLVVNSAAGLQVYFDYPGYGSNKTDGGVTWHTPLYVADCYPNKDGLCSVSFFIDPNPNLKVGDTHTATIVVSGSIPTGRSLTRTTTSAIGQSTYLISQLQSTSFFYLQKFVLAYPGSGPNSAWVHAFINAVNNRRGSSHLVEDPNLDSFAATRLATAVSNYSISDYGFDGQAASFFTGTGRIGTEEILYPQSFAPSGFVSYVQTNAPSHWTGLVSNVYMRYGFAIGRGPVVELSTDCPVTEITAHNVNITQIAIENGCKYQVEDLTYLVLVMST
jgi:hypothetical protein